ncbi:MAG: filamentous hemagglutinin N-terminal domain-containing protein [Tolypothrix carrinoi HA7290-LM1]|nr:filamentous hemagglutinin N-terminal domain-containing protein [Tolypothrix carrinoi HA7290-LM1]
MTTFCTLGLMTSVRAQQVSPDGTLSTTVSSPDNLNFTINNGDRVGGNLFHSFREFSVPNGGSAVFQNPLDVQNIINRVTGGSLSQINGLIQSQGSANLFLLNPAGIFFGPNARLNIGGSFFATTADSFLFENGLEFSATNPQAPLLTVNIPIGLRFRDNPGNITNQSVVQDNTNFPVGLQVNPGNSLALVGGNVSLEQGGRLTAAGGRIELGGLAGAGTVGLDTTGNTFKLNFPINNLSNVSLADDARVAVRSNGGGDIAVNANIFTATNGGRLVGGIEGIATRNGGDITVNSNEFNISGVEPQTQLGSGIYQQVVSDASGNAGNININTKSFNASLSAVLRNRVEFGATGNAGDITIKAGTVSFIDGGRISAGTLGNGNAGNVTINASDRISFDGFNESDGFISGVLNTVDSEATGNAGNIKFNTNNLILSNAEINSSTSGNGNAGNISVEVGEAIALTNSSLITANVQSGGSGKGGDIDIRGRSLTVTDGSQIQAGIFREDSGLPGGIGTGGSIKINASDSVDISGFSFSNGLSGIFASAETGSTGSGGSIDITTNAFRLANFGVVTARTDNGNNGGNITINAKTFEATNGLVQTSLSGQAEAGRLVSAGDIQLNVSDSVTLKDGSQINSSTSGKGNAGNISLQVGEAIALTDSSLITTNVQSGGSGKGGDIDIRGRSLSLTGGSQINSSTFGQGNAGNISLQVGEAIALTDSSLITTNVQPGGSGKGGDIDIQGRTLTLTGGSQIQAGLFAETNGLPGGNGTGGSIKINASDFVDISGFNPVSRLRSGIFAPAETGSTGPGGSIDITTGAFRLSNFGIVTARNDNGNNGGNITINAKTFEATNGLVQTILSGQVETDGLFSAGDIQLNVTDSVSLLDRSLINSSTSGKGNAGNISLQVGEAIALTDSSLITTNVQPGGSGKGGDIDIQGRTLTLTGGSQIQAGLFAETNGLPGGNGTGGSIKINASDFVDISGFDPVSQLQSGIFAPAETGSTGPGGSIDITTGAFRLTNFGVVTAGTANGNNGGDITINAKTFEATNGLVQTILSGQAETDGLFSAGDIQLNVIDSVSLLDRSLINSSTSGKGNAGNISLQVGEAIALANSSQIRSVVEPGGEGIGGNIDIRGRSLTLTEGGAIGTVLFREENGLSGGKGRAGNIEINATDFVNIFGVGTTGFSSGLFASAETGTTAISPQAAGNINLTTGDFRIADGAVVDALTYNSGDAGNITINANTFTASGGGQVITTTFNSGSAGNINLNIRDRITISGSDPNYNQRVEGTFDNQGAASGIFANTAPGSTGNGGNITIQQEQNRFPTIAIADGGEVRVDSQGQGIGGEISITGNNLTLNRGVLSASTESADGGNIDLRLRNFIRLRNESLISANARGQQGGNGGNITINTPFIVAFPQNNDITANAGNGSGGRVIINATLFGIAPLSAADLRRLRPNDLDPRQLPTSDITAISRDNPSLSLPVQVNSPDVDPSRGLVELPETVTDRTQQIAQNPCQQGVGNEFFVTGRGGLPTTPNQTLSSDNVRVDLLQPVASSGNSRSAAIKPATNRTATRVPAKGWILNDKGQVVLTAYDPTNTASQRSFSTAAACPAR